MEIVLRDGDVVIEAAWQWRKPRRRIYYVYWLDCGQQFHFAEFSRISAAYDHFDRLCQWQLEDAAR